MPSPSRAARAALAVSALPVVFGLSGPSVPAPTIAAADVVLVREGDVVREDLYVVGSGVIIEGTVVGDVVILAGDLRLTGTVEGDVVGVVRSALVGGVVGGSVRLLVGEIRTDGRISDDLAVMAASVDATGEVGRDLLAAGGEVRMRGEIGRDLRGWLGGLDLDGRVGRNVEVAVQRMVVGSGARVGRDLVYTSPREGRVSAAAEVGGVLVHREPAPANVRVRAGQRLGAALAFLAFLATGLLALLAAPRTGERAIGAALARPGWSWLVGAALFFLAPLAALVVAGTVVGIPLALVLVGSWLLGLMVGPVPALAAVGRRILGRGVSAYGAFLLGGLLWVVLLALPVIGGVAYLLALFWGLGAWVTGMLAVRGAPPEDAGDDAPATAEAGGAGA